MPTNTRTKAELLGSRAHMPEDVVHRTFVKETVLLNLSTGKYHGINPVGGHMIEIVTKAPDLEHAATVLAGEYGRPAEEIADDLCDFCVNLEERGLISLEGQSDDRREP
jgi:hypothetical protein